MSIATTMSEVLNQKEITINKNINKIFNLSTFYQTSTFITQNTNLIHLKAASQIWGGDAINVIIQGVTQLGTYKLMQKVESIELTESEIIQTGDYVIFKYPGDNNTQYLRITTSDSLRKIVFDNRYATVFQINRTSSATAITLQAIIGSTLIPIKENSTTPSLQCTGECWQTYMTPGFYPYSETYIGYGGTPQNVSDTLLYLSNLQDAEFQLTIPPVGFSIGNTLLFDFLSDSEVSATNLLKFGMQFPNNADDRIHSLASFDVTSLLLRAQPITVEWSDIDTALVFSITYDSESTGWAKTLNTTDMTCWWDYRCELPGRGWSYDNNTNISAKVQMSHDIKTLINNYGARSLKISTAVTPIHKREIQNRLNCVLRNQFVPKIHNFYRNRNVETTAAGSIDTFIAEIPFETAFMRMAVVVKVRVCFPDLISDVLTEKHLGTSSKTNKPFMFPPLTDLSINVYHRDYDPRNSVDVRVSENNPQQLMQPRVFVTNTGNIAFSKNKKSVAPSVPLLADFWLYTEPQNKQPIVMEGPIMAINQNDTSLYMQNIKFPNDWWIFSEGTTIPKNLSPNNSYVNHKSYNTGECPYTTEIDAIDAMEKQSTYLNLQTKEEKLDQINTCKNTWYSNDYGGISPWVKNSSTPYRTTYNCQKKLNYTIGSTGQNGEYCTADVDCNKHNNSATGMCYIQNGDYSNGEEVGCCQNICTPLTPSTFCKKCPNYAKKDLDFTQQKYKENIHNIVKNDCRGVSLGRGNILSQDVFFDNENMVENQETFTCTIPYVFPIHNSDTHPNTALAVEGPVCKMLPSINESQCPITWRLNGTNNSRFCQMGHGRSYNAAGVPQYTEPNENGYAFEPQRVSNEETQYLEGGACAVTEMFNLQGNDDKVIKEPIDFYGNSLFDRFKHKRYSNYIRCAAPNNAYFKDDATRNSTLRKMSIRTRALQVMYDDQNNQSQQMWIQLNKFQQTSNEVSLKFWQINSRNVIDNNVLVRMNRLNVTTWDTHTILKQGDSFNFILIDSGDTLCDRDIDFPIDGDVVIDINNTPTGMAGSYFILQELFNNQKTYKYAPLLDNLPLFSSNESVYHVFTSRKLFQYTLFIEKLAEIAKYGHIYLIRNDYYQSKFDDYDKSTSKAYTLYNEFSKEYCQDFTASFYDSDGNIISPGPPAVERQEKSYKDIFQYITKIVNVLTSTVQDIKSTEEEYKQASADLLMSDIFAFSAVDGSLSQLTHRVKIIEVLKRRTVPFKMSYNITHTVKDKFTKNQFIEFIQNIDKIITGNNGISPTPFWVTGRYLDPICNFISTWVSNESESSPVFPNQTLDKQYIKGNNPENWANIYPRTLTAYQIFNSNPTKLDTTTYMSNELIENSTRRMVMGNYKTATTNGIVQENGFMESIAMSAKDCENCGSIISTSNQNFNRINNESTVLTNGSTNKYRQDFCGCAKKTTQSKQELNVAQYITANMINYDMKIDYNCDNNIAVQQIDTNNNNNNNNNQNNGNIIISQDCNFLNPGIKTDLDANTGTDETPNTNTETDATSNINTETNANQSTHMDPGTDVTQENINNVILPPVIIGIVISVSVLLIVIIIVIIYIVYYINK